MKRANTAPFCPSDGPRHSWRLRLSLRGFTLIELLVSIAILSTGIVVVLEAFQTSLVALQETREVTLSDMLLRQRMAAIETELNAAPSVVPTSANGSFSGEFSQYRWSQYVSASKPEGVSADGPGRVASVTIDVWRRGSSLSRSIDTAYFIAEPQDE